MVYEDYKKASTRHLKTCQYICGPLGQISSTREKSLILANAYYLSDYIIECIINYAIYDYVGYSRTRNVKRLNDSANSVSFRREVGTRYHIMSHKFQKNAQVLSSLPSIADIPFIEVSYIPSKYRPVQSLYKQWSPSARYEDNNYSEIQVRLFVELATEIRQKILSNVTMG